MAESKCRSDKHSLATDAIHVEQDLIGEAVGSQDQVTAAYGGFNRIYFNTDGGIEVQIGKTFAGHRCHSRRTRFDWRGRGVARPGYRRLRRVQPYLFQHRWRNRSADRKNIRWPPMPFTSNKI